MTLLELLVESQELTLCSCFLILKVDKSKNRTDVFNRIRALSGVIIVDPVTSELVGRRDTDTHAFSLVELKYIVETNAMTDLETIRKRILSGDQYTPAVEGVVGVHIQAKTLKQVKN